MYRKLFRCLVAAALWCVALPHALAEEAPRHAPQQGVAYFDVYADGDTLHLLTGHRGAGVKGVALWYRQSRDGGASWSTPTRVNAAESDVFAPHPGENPQIAARGNRVLAMWNGLDDNGQPNGLVTKLSLDGGKTFADTGKPAGDASGYDALAELGADADRFHAVWLHDAVRGGAQKQALHYATSRDGKRWSDDLRIDTDTCACCWNRVVADAGRVGVLYRAGGPRDMKFAVAANGSWSSASTVGAFDWEFKGCPHVGGALTMVDNTLDALVWTGKESRQGLYFLHSDDRGTGWSEPHRLGGVDAKDSDLARASDGSLVAVWDGEGGIQTSRSADAGKTWTPAQAVSPRGDRQRHPRTLSTRSGVLTFWLEGPSDATRLNSTAGVIVAPND